MKSIKTFFAFPTLVLSAMLLGTLGLLDSKYTQAADFNGYFGAQLGLGAVSGNVGSGFTYGLNGGYFFHPDFGAGAFLRSSSHDQGITLMSFGGEFLYRMSEIVPGLTLGLGAGEAKFSGGAFDGNFHFMGGGKAFYEFYIPAYLPLALGVEAKLMWTKPVADILTILDTVATVKFWF